MNRRLYRNKKAVSPVIATMLMILVVMIGMTVAFSYVVFYTDNYKAGVGSSVLETLTIEDVWYEPNTNPDYPLHKIHVTVYNPATKANMGYDVNLEVSMIYLDGSALADVNAGPVKAGEHVTFTGTRIRSLDSGQDYIIQVTTLRGSNFRISFEP